MKTIRKHLQKTVCNFLFTVALRLFEFSTWLQGNSVDETATPNELAQRFLDEDRLSDNLNRNQPLLHGRVLIFPASPELLVQLQASRVTAQPGQLPVLVVGPDPEHELETSVMIFTLDDFYKTSAAWALANNSLPMMNELFI